MAEWTWAAASRRGTAHAQAGERRQDACRVLTAEPGFVIVVACDGAGSAVLGGYGAALATRVLSNRAKNWVSSKGLIPTADALALWVAEVRLMILASANRLGCVAGDFATTLVMAVSDGTSTVCAHVGDGAIVARRTGSTDLEALSWPHNGDYASTTFFLTDLNPCLRVGVINGIPLNRLALLTDGIERLALDFAGRVAHRPFFDGIFGTITVENVAGPDRLLSRRLAAFLDSKTVNARTDDDKTLILAALR